MQDNFLAVKQLNFANLLLQELQKDSIMFA
jgi:hypothetical protein